MNKPKKTKVTLTIDSELWKSCKELQSRVSVNFSAIAEQSLRRSFPFWEKVASYLEETQQQLPVLYPSLGDIPDGDYDVIPEVVIPKTFYNISDEDAVASDLERVIYVHIVPKEEVEE